MKAACRVSILALTLVGGAWSALAQQSMIEDVGLPISDPDDILAVCGGDPDAGIPNFAASCASCHTLSEGDAHLEGPNLYGLYGRTAGTAAGFAYSDAMVTAGTAGLVWGRETLQPYFQDAQAVAPGSIHPALPEMMNDTYRTDLMTYVRLVTTPPPPDIADVEVPADVLAMEGDFAYGEYLGSGCVACHVAGGASDGNIPIIHGLDREYVLLALFQYRLGARDNATMANAIAGLGDEELAALAAYFSAQ